MSKEDLMLSKEEKELVEKIQASYRSSYLYKESLGLSEIWRDCQDYWAGNVNIPEDEDDPGSETNIIQAIIESQVADLVDGTLDLTVKPVGPSDHPFAKDIRTVLKWVWNKNRMTIKLDEGERDRLNLGTCGWKVFWDSDAMNGRGLATIEPRSPDTMFPDPKIKKPERIQEGDFFIDVSPCTRRYLVQRFGDKGKLVKPEGSFSSYDPRIFGEQDHEGADEVINDQALLYEYWEKDEDGKLRLVYMAGGRILKDSNDTKDKEGASVSFYEHGKYPFVLIPCYRTKGRVWGLGDTEQLISTQDLINDLDDQIRMNAHLVGNIQTVVGLSAGINLKKWTNKPGLKIPAKDHTAFKEVQPPTMPGYITQRRLEGFNESELISGRSDVVEGRRSGSLRSASAIMALQEAGSRRSKHKKLMLQEGFVEIFDLLLAYVQEFMTEEKAIEITEAEKTDYIFFRGSDLKDIPVLTRNENFDPTKEDDGTERFKPLFDEKGTEPMKKQIEVDIEVSFGAGMPNSPSFLYQSTLDLARENLVTQQEARQTLKSILNWPMMDPMNPVGQFAGRNNSAEQMAMINGQDPNQVLGKGGQPTPEGGMPVQGQDQGQDPLAQLEQAVSQLPPELLQQFILQLTGGAGIVNPQQGGPGPQMG